MIQIDLDNYFHEHEMLFKKRFFGKLFGATVEEDLIIIYKPAAVDYLPKIKEDVERLLDSYLIRSDTNQNKLVLMSQSEFEKRYRLADKFVLTIMRQCKGGEAKN